MDKQKEKRPHFLDEYDGEYIGNIWGWKVSLIGLAVIIILSLYVGYKFWTQEEILPNTPEKQEISIENEK